MTWITPLQDHTLPWTMVALLALPTTVLASDLYWTWAVLTPRSSPSRVEMDSPSTRDSKGNTLPATWYLRTFVKKSLLARTSSAVTFSAAKSFSNAALVRPSSLRVNRHWPR